jgi:hypothetical protein
MYPAIESHLARPDAAPPELSTLDWVVIVSQTCDVLATKLDAEPYVEVLHCRVLDGKPRKGRRDLQSTRYLDFRPSREAHPDTVLSAHAVRDRYLIPRQLLAQYQPDSKRSTDESAARRLLNWYSLRAARPSWPDAFVERISTARQALEDALANLVDDIAQVRIAIRERDTELPPDQPYRIAIFFVVDEDTWNKDVEGRKAVQKSFNQFVSALNACDGISVEDAHSGVVSGAQFTWQQTQMTDEWNFANLSHRDPE